MKKKAKRKYKKKVTHEELRSILLSVEAFVKNKQGQTLSLLDLSQLRNMVILSNERWVKK